MHTTKVRALDDVGAALSYDNVVVRSGSGVCYVYCAKQNTQAIADMLKAAFDDIEPEKNCEKTQYFTMFTVPGSIRVVYPAIRMALGIV